MNKTMVKENENKGSLKQAKEWCEKAREILKLKGFVKKDSVDTQYLDEALATVNNDLKSLKEAIKNCKIATQKKALELQNASYEQDFIRIAKIAKEAKERKNAELARIVTAQLQHLHSNFQKPEDKVEANALLLKKVKLQYEGALSIANGMHDELKQKACGDRQFVATIPLMISNTKLSITNVLNEAPKSSESEDAKFVQQCIETYIAATKELGHVRSEYKNQLKIYSEYQPQYQKYLVELKEATDRVACIQNASGNVDSANKNLTEARRLAGDFDISGARDSLKKVNEACETAKKGKAFDKKGYSELRNGQVAFEKARVTFEEAYRIANEEFIKSTSLFGLVIGIPEVVGDINVVRTQLKLSRRNGDSAIEKHHRDLTKFQDNIKLLETATALAKQCCNEYIPLAKKSSEEAKKKIKENDGQRVKEWQELLRQAMFDLKVCSSTGESDAAQKCKLKIEKLIEDAKFVVEGEGRRDYPTAISMLEKYKPAFEEFRKLPKTLQNVDTGSEFSELRKTIESKLETNKNFCPPYFGPSYLREMEEIFLKAKEDNLQEFALGQLRSLEQQLNRECNELTQACIAAVASKIAFNKMDTEVLKDIPDYLKVPALQLADLALVRMDKHDWVEAQDLFDLASKTLKEFEESKTDLENANREWQLREKKVTEILDFAVAASSWMPLAMMAMKVVTAAKKLRFDFESGHDYELHEQRCVALEELHKQLQVLVQDMHLPIDVKDLRESLAKIREAAKSFDEEVDFARQQAGKHIQLLLAKLPNGNSSDLDFEERHYKIENAWLSKSSIKNVTTKELEQLKETVVADFNKLAQDTDLGPNELLNLQGEIERKINEKVKNNPEIVIRQDLQILKGLGVDTSDYEKQLAEGLENREKLKKENSGKDELLPELAKLLGEEVKKAQLAKEEHAKLLSEKAEKGKLLLGKISSLLQDNYLKFKSKGLIWVTSYDKYKEALETQSKDIAFLFESNDPELIELANNEMKSLFQSIKEVTPDAKPSFDDVHKRHKYLAQLLGVDSDRIVIKYMKDTADRLAGRLDDAFAMAQKSSPKDGLAMLGDSIEKDIQLAIEQATELKRQRELFNQRRDKIENLWTGIKKQTRTWTTERTKAFGGHVEGVIANAEKVRKEENEGMSKALKALEDLEKELLGIVNGPDETDDGKTPRTRLIEKDSQFAEKQRQIKEMVRQFDEEARTFKETRIKQVEEAFAEKVKKMTTKKEQEIEAKQGKMVAKEMKNRVDEAKQLLKGLGDDPVMAKKQLFSARQILIEQETVARRMIGVTQTTNVKLTKNLKAVLQNWKDKTTYYVSTIEALAKSVESTNEVIDEETKKAAASMIRGLKNQFPLDAFDKPIAVLLNSEDPNEKRAAREEGLRIMRQQRDIIHSNPAIRRLMENPLDPSSMMAAIAYLRQSLKSLELEISVGV